MNFRAAYIYLILQESEVDDHEMIFRRMGVDRGKARKMAELLSKEVRGLTDQELRKLHAYYGLIKTYYEREAEKLKKGEEETEKTQEEIDFLKSGGPVDADDDPADWWKKQ